MFPVRVVRDGGMNKTVDMILTIVNVSIRFVPC